MMPRGIFSSPKTSTQSWRPLATAAAPQALETRLGEPRDDAQPALQLDDTEAVRYLAAVAGRAREDGGVEVEPPRGSDARLARVVRAAVRADRRGREAELAAGHAARGEEARSVARAHEQPFADRPCGGHTSAP